MSVNKEAMQRWVDALRGGKYRQVQGTLFGMGYAACAIGVGIKVSGNRDGGGIMAVKETYGQPRSALDEIIVWNDIDQRDFFEIADLLYAKYLKDPE